MTIPIRHKRLLAVFVRRPPQPNAHHRQVNGVEGKFTERENVLLFSFATVSSTPIFNIILYKTNVKTNFKVSLYQAESTTFK